MAGFGGTAGNGMALPLFFLLAPVIQRPAGELGCRGEHNDSRPDRSNPKLE